LRGQLRLLRLGAGFLAQDDRALRDRVADFGVRGFFFEGDGLEHQRLGEEGAADGGLFLDRSDAEHGEARRAGEAAGVEEEDGGCGLVGVGSGVLRRFKRNAGILPTPASKLAGGPFAALRMTSEQEGRQVSRKAW
jgi:hypothetical protein